MKRTECLMVFISVKKCNNNIEMSEHFCKEIVKLNKDLHCLAGMSTNFHEIFRRFNFFVCPIGLFQNPLDFLVDKIYNIDKNWDYKLLR